MATSGTYAFNPAISDVVINAYSRIGIRATALTSQHMLDAEQESNYLLIEWSNKQPNLWASELLSIPLIQGTATYSVPARTVMILIAFISITAGDLVMTPVSTTEYASFPNKALQAPPNVYWFDRQISPTVTLWPVPDDGGPYTLNLRTVRQMQDATMQGGVNPEVPYRFLDAFAAGLAARLARIYAPAFEMLRKQDAMEAWNNAATQDTENVPFYLTPSLSGYFD